MLRKASFRLAPRKRGGCLPEGEARGGDWYFYPEQKNPGNELKQGDIIVAYSERGMELAKVLNKSMDDFKRQNKINFIKNGFVRKAEAADFEREKQLEIKAQSAKEVILRVNKELGIKMKIIKVKYTLDDSRSLVCRT